MKATHRVKNSQNKTVGFIIDNSRFENYYNVLNNINYVDNLKSDKAGVIKSKYKALPTCTVKALNNDIYKRLCIENPLEREVQSQFNKWYKHWSNKVLYLTGARQVGKTTELKKFAYKHYEQIIYVNLSNQASSEAFERAVNSGSIVFGMIDFCKKNMGIDFYDSENTILIIDEIQESPVIYNAIRTLQGNLKCHIAVTGSYLGKTLNSKYFKPAGNVIEVEMLPLSFKEFCKALGIDTKLMNVDLFGNSESTTYEELNNAYNVYIKIGGYPEVIRQYIKTNSIEDCRTIIESLIKRFTEESASYFEDDKCLAIFENVYKAAFINLAKEKKGTSSNDIDDITTFVKADTREHVSRAEINKAVSWLEYSKIIGTCDLYNQGNVNELLSDRRFYFMDCGIVNYVASLTAIQNSTVQGIIAENFVYTELYRLYKQKSALKGDKPCCSVYNNYELDFMIVDKNDKKIGIEVKSTKSTKHESINEYIRHHFINDGYIAEITYGKKGKFISEIPIYTVGCRFPYK
jgi:hypothetical protein